MRFTGTGFEYADETERVVTGAVESGGRIAIDWIEGNAHGHLILTSEDGIHYAGQYGYPTLEERYQARFRRYRAKDGQVLLMGRYWHTDAPEAGPWVFVLNPVKSASARK